jgi:hypothetical protein
MKTCMLAFAVLTCSGRSERTTTCYPLSSGSQVCTDAATEFRCIPGPGGGALTWVERHTGERKASAADCMAWRDAR